MKAILRENGALEIPRCPGCGRCHVFPVSTLNTPEARKRNWHWNGDLEKITIEPSLKHSQDLPKGQSWICHYRLIEGRMHFCEDCTGGHANSVRELPDL